MTVFPLLAAGFMTFIAYLFVICSIVLVLVILIQKGKGGGLSAAFGGGGAGGVLGAKTKEPLTWFTIGLVSFFLLLAVILAKWYKPAISDFGTEQTQQAPVRQEQTTDLEQLPLPDVTRDANAGTDTTSPGG